MKRIPTKLLLVEIGIRILVVLGAGGFTLAFFLILPVMQSIAKPPKTDLLVQSVDTGKLEAPEQPPEIEEEKPEPEPEEQPPELTDEAPPMSLDMLELALNPGFGEGMTGGDFAIKLNTVMANNGNDVDELFSIADLDQKPRAIYTPGPVLNEKLRKKRPGKVYIIFIVDERGRVQNPKIQKTSDPEFNEPALKAVEKWKFEPGKKNGKSVKSRMRLPMSF